jgi:hypothetical protein
MRKAGERIEHGPNLFCEAAYGEQQFRFHCFEGARRAVATTITLPVDSKGLMPCGEVAEPG